jgi:xanthine dehydrogenase accessory factor
MESLDVRVLRDMRDWRAAGVPVLFATVVNTWGSSPRPIGSIMAISGAGKVVGSVSGGCIEDDLIANYVGQSAGGPPKLVRYGVTADEAHRFGLPCGGTVELLLEYDPDAGALKALLETLDEGLLARRQVDLCTGAVMLSEATRPEGLSRGETWIVNTFGPAYRMLLIGAGQLTEYLATMALFSGFEVTVCDPRSEYHRTWNVAAAKLVTEMPDDVVAAFRADSRSCIVALTHDPKLDDLALLEAARSRAFYVGAIGSRRNQAARIERLKEHFGLTSAEAGRLRGPAGIYVGSKTPAEIAVSIMAEILAVKNNVEVPAAMRVAEAKERALI